MFPFKHSTQEMFNSFFDQLYKLCRFGVHFQESEVEQLEKAMRRNLSKPGKLFKMLMQGEEESYRSYLSSIEKEEEVVVPKTENEIIEVEDDLEEYNNINSVLALLPKDFFRGLDPSESKLINQRMAETMQPQKQIQQQESDSSEDDFQEQFKLAQETRSLAKKHSSVHIGGIYTSSSKKHVSHKNCQNVSMPILLVKHRDSGEEDILINCSSVLDFGDVKTVNRYLKEEEKQSQALKFSSEMLP